MAREHAVPALAKALRDPVEDVRVNAARALGLLGKDAAEAGSPLVRALGDRSASVRRNASSALGDVPSPPGEAVPALARALSDADTLVASNAARALRSLGEKALPALKDLEAALARDLEKPRSTLPVDVPSLAGRGGISATPTLSVNLLLALGNLGPGAAPALPTIFRALRSPNVPARNAAVQAIAAIRSDPAKSVAALAAALEDPDETVRGPAAFALGDFGPDARPVIPALERLRDRSEGRVRQNAQYALDRIAGKEVPTGAGPEAPADPGGMTLHGGGGGTVEVWR